MGRRLVREVDPPEAHRRPLPNIPEGLLPSPLYRLSSVGWVDQGFNSREMGELELADREISPLTEPSHQLGRIGPRRPLRSVWQADDPGFGVVKHHVLALEETHRILDELGRPM